MIFLADLEFDPSVGNVPKALRYRRLYS
jgi:hypothetical protein